MKREIAVFILNNYGFIIISLWKDTQRHRWTNRKSKRRNTDF